jgi:hypothetical protein
VTLPVGFDFYMPDPQLKAWEKKDKELQKKGIKKKERPPKPIRDERYPKKETIALNLLREFRTYHLSSSDRDKMCRGRCPVWHR